MAKCQTSNITFISFKFEGFCQCCRWNILLCYNHNHNIQDFTLKCPIVSKLIIWLTHWPLLPVLPVLGLYGWCYELVTRICPINHPTSAIRTSVAKWNDVFCPLRLCSYFILHTLNEDKYIFYPLCDSSSDEVWWQIVWWAIVVLTLISFPSYLDLICILRLFNSKMSPQ